MDLSRGMVSVKVTERSRCGRGLGVWVYRWGKLWVVGVCRIVWVEGWESMGGDGLEKVVESQHCVRWVETPQPLESHHL